MDEYAEVGVDIRASSRFIEAINPIISKTFKPNVISSVGSYAALYSIASNLENIKKPVLVSSTDGVGTKLKIAFMLDKHDTIGIDLVAMCVNDIITQGATPLFLLDYLSMGKLDNDRAVDIVKGIAIGCEKANCSFIAGETAEMPGFYATNEYDLAGFTVGLIDADQIIDGSGISIGHQLIGIGSSGLHSNGYSLVRKIFFDQLNMSVDDYVDEFDRTVGEELLEPTKIYVGVVNFLTKNFNIFGIAHITGGGIIENLPRILPNNCQAMITQSSWEPQNIFKFIKKAKNISEEKMMGIFNIGIGLIIVVAKKDVEDILYQIKALGERAFHIGWIERRNSNSQLKILK